MILPPKKAALFDLETNGLLSEVTKVHVMAVRCLTTGKLRVFREHQMAEGLSYLDQFDLLVGHNIINFDVPVLTKLYGYNRPWFTLRDTLVLSRLIWTDLWDEDKKLVAKGKMPSKLMNRHSLEAWGHRFGTYKDDYRGDSLLAAKYIKQGMSEEEAWAITESKKWESWNQDMEDYCVQDLAVTAKLWSRIEAKGWAEESCLLELQVAHILSRQERHGFLFDQTKAPVLYGKLVQRKAEIETELQKVFTPITVPHGKPFVPKRDNRTLGYKAGVPVQKYKTLVFNPGSRTHIALWFQKWYGWQPSEFTADGKPKVDETVISKLDYPEAKPLKEYLMVAKRIGQLAEGDEAWLRHIKPDGRIHGSVNPMGAVTGRMTHSRPNLAQVPAGYSPYGHDCRELFIVPAGKKLLGCDASALELCDLAGYMARYDEGAYVKTVLEGDKKLGTDIHSVNARALGLDPKGTYFDGESGRDIAKTWFYAFIYGAGDEKLGFILTRVKDPEVFNERGRKLPGPTSKKGAKARADFLTNLPAMGKLVEAVKARAKDQGWLRGLDGRQIKVRSQHAALNSLLQCAGAVQMKKALCILDDNLQALGYVPGLHYEFVANVHDEWQIEVDDDKVETVGPMAAEAIRLAGEAFKFACPLSGEWRAGSSWAETH